MSGSGFEEDLALSVSSMTKRKLTCARLFVLPLVTYFLRNWLCFARLCSKKTVMKQPNPRGVDTFHFSFIDVQQHVCVCVRVCVCVCVCDNMQTHSEVRSVFYWRHSASSVQCLVGTFLKLTNSNNLLKKECVYVERECVSLVVGWVSRVRVLRKRASAAQVNTLKAK